MRCSGPKWRSSGPKWRSSGPKLLWIAPKCLCRGPKCRSSTAPSVGGTVGITIRPSERRTQLASTQDAALRLTATADQAVGLFAKDAVPLSPRVLSPLLGTGDLSGPGHQRASQYDCRCRSKNHVCKLGGSAADYKRAVASRPQPGRRPSIGAVPGARRRASRRLGGRRDSRCSGRSGRAAASRRDRSCRRRGGSLHRRPGHRSCAVPGPGS